MANTRADETTLLIENSDDDVKERELANPIEKSNINQPKLLTLQDLPQDIINNISIKLRYNNTLLNLRLTSKKLCQAVDATWAGKYVQIGKDRTPHSISIWIADSNPPSSHVCDHGDCNTKCPKCCSSYCCCCYDSCCCTAQTVGYFVGTGAAITAATYVFAGAKITTIPAVNYLIIGGVSLVYGCGGWLAGLGCVAIPYGIYKLGLFAYDKCKNQIKEDIQPDRDLVKEIKSNIQRNPIDQDEYVATANKLGLKV
jgi:F-box domain